jgi:hypothetical protein
MFKVYWTDHQDTSYGKQFEKMTEALKFTQDLRNVYQRKFVTMVSENPDCTSLLGVSEVNANYDFKKRRT